MFGLTLVPILLKQLNELTGRLPIWIQSGSQQLQIFNNWLVAQNIPLDLSGLTAQFANLLPNQLRVLPNQVLEFVLGVAGSVVELVLTAVFTLYLLLHGNEFWHGLLRWLPRDIGRQIHQALRQQFRNYFIGQAAIAMLMGSVLTLAFFWLKIPFWLVFGVGIGATVLIPFGDFLGIGIVSFIVALKSIWLGVEVLAISILVDQIIDQIISPRILGKFVGLNPIWVLLALLIGAQIGGVLGLVIAVPLAGSIKRVGDTLQPAEVTASSELNVSSERQPAT